jgi:hypothetical protein
MKLYTLVCQLARLCSPICSFWVFLPALVYCEVAQNPLE